MGHFAHSGQLGGITLPLEIFRDPRLKECDIRFLVALIEHRNGKTGQVNPGEKAIAATSGLSKSSIERARINLKRFGWIKYTSGNTKTANDYVITVPLKAEFKYRVRAEKMENGEWKAEVARREKDAKGYALAKTRTREQWYMLDEWQLIEELELEKKAGKRYIPDYVLEECEILRDGDNSLEARILRKEQREGRKKATPGGVPDPYEVELDDFKETAPVENEYAGYTRAQLVDLQFSGVQLPRSVIEKYNLDPSL